MPRSKIKNAFIQPLLEEDPNDTYGPHLKGYFNYQDVPTNIEQHSAKEIIREIRRLFSLERFHFVDNSGSLMVYDLYKPTGISALVIDADFRPTLMENIMDCLFKLDNEKSLYDYLHSLK